MTDNLPTHQYYRACEGRWRSPFDLTLTDAAALDASGVARADRFALRALLAFARVFGGLTLDTRVSCEGIASRGEVLHTTRVSKGGVAMMESREVLTLDPDGRRLAMRIETRTFPFLGAPRVDVATGVADEDAMRVTYAIAWLGATLRQVGERSADGQRVTLTQETTFSRGVQRLERVGA